LAFKYADAQEDQGRLPYWDQFDRRLPRRTVRYGLSNSLVAKTPIQPNDPAADRGGEPVAALEDNDYFQFLKFGLWSSYELANNSHMINQPEYDRYYDATYFGRGSGPLEASLEAFLNPYVSAQLISAFNTRTGRAMSHDLSLRLADDRGDWLALTYDYDQPEAQLKPVYSPGHQEARADLGLRLNSEWSTRLFTRFDLNDHQALESMAMLTYQAQCYGLSLVYAKTYQDHTVGVVFDLMGLGSIDFSGADRRN
jgi:hypothetical protein